MSLDFLQALLRPEVLWAVIPIVAIIMIFGSKMLARYFEHQERIAKIEAGIDPDARDPQELD